MKPAPLWLALHFPCLPLEACAPPSSPSAVVYQGKILLADDLAQAAGIEKGTGISAARMLAPDIMLMARDPSLEAAALHRLACWAGRFTPRISLTPATLLLEIGSCLRLFGGMKTLLPAVAAGVQAQGFRVELAAAPTPLGAQWLAQEGQPVFCRDPNKLRAHLEALPISVLPDKAAAALQRFGAHTLADVRRLPSAGLARRIGAEALQHMARAFGEMPDPRADFVFPDQFSLPLPLPAAVDNAIALLFAARRLTSALAGWLAVRQAGVREVILFLQHRDETTELVLQFTDLTSDEKRFERVLRELLERLVLKAPVELLRLEAQQVTARPRRNGSLFENPETTQDALNALLERLRARLGEHQVYGLAVQDDHRPERATRHTALFEKAAQTGGVSFPRPLWLLDRPLPLSEIDGRPYREGPLKLLGGPERIESGWWDQGEVCGESTSGESTSGDLRRDYFIALSETASWLWIYRECQAPGGWFLHGYFS